ncbi:MAG: DUF1311 domain-containing protein [Oscillospiraceae bacterium]|nr:DUF1311 domain-containing protein [Oscillospiraceae bacterium]
MYQIKQNPAKRATAFVLALLLSGAALLTGCSDDEGSRGYGNEYRLSNLMDNTQDNGTESSIPRHAPNMYVDWESDLRYDAVEVDWYCEIDAENTYWAVHNWNGGYAGFQNKGGKHSLFLSLAGTTDAYSTVEYAYNGSGVDIGVGGTGKEVTANYNWEAGKWYSMRVQVERTGGKTVFSQWLKEGNGDWIKTAAISCPAVEFYFEGVSVLQKDTTFNNYMRKCRLRNACGKIYGTDNWNYIEECVIKNTYLPADGATGGNEVWNATYDCNWGIGDDYVWVQSGGEGFTPNGKSLPAKYTLLKHSGNTAPVNDAAEEAEPESVPDVTVMEVRLAKKNEFLDKAAEIESYAELYLENAMSQMDINRESGVVYKKWDELLNEVYQYLKTVLTYEEFERLKKDEIEWVKIKEAEIEAAGAEWEGGSGEPMARNMAGIACTEERCYYLIDLIEV